jgi:hypothetical protein
MSDKKEQSEDERRTELAMLKLLASRYPKEAKKFAEKAELVQIYDNTKKARQDFPLTKKIS